MGETQESTRASKTLQEILSCKGGVETLINRANLVKEILKSSGYWVLNKSIVKEYGIECALLLSVFDEAEAMMGDNEGWFCQTAETIEELTGLSRFKQDKIIAKLEQQGIVQKEVRGVPARRHFKLVRVNDRKNL